MQCYLTGRALRNELLDLPVVQREWLCHATDSHRLEDDAFVPHEGSARRYLERDSGDIYWPWCAEQRGDGPAQLNLRCEASLSIGDVLALRDLTIHAMARDANGELFDPHDGFDDLQEGFLRHVTPHFVRHPDYLLGVAEAAAELVNWGFRVAHGTYGLMRKMVNDQAVQSITREQRFASLKRALYSATPLEYFRVLQRCGALRELSPSLDALYQQAPGHSAGQSAPSLLEQFDRQRASGGDVLEAFATVIRRYDTQVLRDLGVQN